MAHLTCEILEARFRELPPPPTDEGEVVLVVVRPETNERVTPARARLTREYGVEGDRWSRRENPSSRSQITVMRADVAGLVADGQPIALCGDNLQVRLDLSTDNLPAGTRLRVGTALCEVTAKPHTGCGKFAARFGPEAREWTNSPENSAYRLRGIHLCVLEPGEVGPGDPIRVVARPDRQLSLNTDLDESGVSGG